MLDAIRRALPDALATHVRQAFEKGDELVILADSAAWAARVRLALTEHPDVSPKRLKVKVAPPGNSIR